MKKNNKVSYHDFCVAIGCEILALDEEGTRNENCHKCKAYLMFKFLRQQDKKELKQDTNSRVEQIIAPYNGKILSEYKRAFRLACEDVKDSRRFCPRFFKLWDCGLTKCPDVSREWRCWAMAYMTMVRKPDPARKD